MSPLLLFCLLARVSAIRVMSGTTSELHDYDEPLSRSVEAPGPGSAEKDEDGNDIPPEPKHHGYHMMPKLSKDAVGELVWMPPNCRGVHFVSFQNANETNITNGMVVVHKKPSEVN
jgi:hypothetical protein